MGNELFQPVPPRVVRMSSKRKSDIIDTFIQRGRHYSPSGLTANLVANWCLQNKETFFVSYDPDIGFIILKGNPNGH